MDMDPAERGGVEVGLRILPREGLYDSLTQVGTSIPTCFEVFPPRPGEAGRFI